MLNLDQLDMAKLFYRPYCSNNEIEKIFNVQSTEDYLLKMRADAVADHVRIYRVMRKRISLNERAWNFTNHFSTKEFESYIRRLDKNNQSKVSDLTAGFIFNNDVNGSCIRSDYGDLIVVSESLRFFLYFMNLHFMDFDDFEVPIDVRESALLIGIRTMLMTESLDFELDPRGIVPDKIHNMINFFVDKQLEFIIGHEYAHYLLKHLDTRNLTEKPLINLFDRQNDEDLQPFQTHKFYNNSQLQEFEADKGAFDFANYNTTEFNQSISSVFSFFLHLDLYRAVIDTIAPSINSIQTHPDPIDRLWSLYGYFEERITAIDKSYLEEVISANDEKKRELQEHIGFNVELYEFYGSVYLGQWRGPILKDRIDY